MTQISNAIQQNPAIESLAKEIRASARAKPPAATRHLAFAAALLARFRQWQPGPTRLPLLFLSFPAKTNPAARKTAAQPSWWQLHFAPRLQLTLLQAAAGAKNQPIATVAPATGLRWQLARPPLAAPLTPQVIRWLTRHESAPTIHHLEPGERLLGRGRRIEGSSHAGPLPSPNGAAPPVRPIPRSLRRQPAFAGEPEASDPAAGHAAAPRSGSTPWATPPPPSPALALTIERLTDQVIQQLDQRVIAYRERTGRS